MTNGVAKILGRGLAPLACPGDACRGAVLLDDVRMRDGDLADALVEVLGRIAALLHHLLHEQVGFDDGALRIVDEARLRRLPAPRVAVARLRRQRPDVELLMPLLAVT